VVEEHKNMKTTLNKKQFGYIISLLGIVLLLGITIGYSVAPTGTFFISSGIYPGAPSYTIWKEGTDYFAKNANGQLIYTSTNASELIQNTINSIPIATTSKILIVPGSYNLDTKINVQKYDMTIEGEGIQTELIYSGTDACIQIGDGITDYYYNNIRNIRIRLTGVNSIGLLILGNTYYGEIDRLRVQGTSGNNNTGIAFIATSLWNGYYTLFNPHITSCHYGMNFLGSHDKTGIELFGGYMQGEGVVNGTGITLNTTNTFQLYGTSISGYNTSIRLDNSYANNIIGLRSETTTYGVFIASTSHQNFIGRASLTGVTFKIVDNGNFNRIRYCYDYWTEQSGITYTNANTTVTFLHNLESTPTLVLASFNSTATGTWQWIATATHITITVLNAGTYKITWYAEYQP
jgi:hypothetical protein